MHFESSVVIAWHLYAYKKGKKYDLYVVCIIMSRRSKYEIILLKALISLTKVIIKFLNSVNNIKLLTFYIKFNYVAKNGDYI